MSGKAISNSTLGLRFMQNAQRAKLQAQVEAEQAKIRDDAEWSVSQDVRDAWGTDASSSSTSGLKQKKTQSVTYEASYVPFIFDEEEKEEGEDDMGASSALVRGRRSFNERGQEVLRKEVRESDNEAEGPAGEAAGRSDPLKGKGRPGSISGFKAPLPTKSKDSKKARTKTAQQLVHETAAVASVSLSSAPPSRAAVAKSEPAGFMKPAGVDAPPPTNAKQGQKKRQRDRDSTVDSTESKGKKRKKKVEADLATVG
ncbi:uncharacterized protein B0H18DRAFT_1018643 [Fomitopsis serialis]|uniref:uncharacterized protein n=1 Tax=Fomitopsis serialis TaxID=139415 RepID=UPI0020088248|nr:uncharacterized protein B0H18DRAFT_1018643 [Neoantrodia serialis]KAH9922227.1 hypothetical protein B0H18DRAFT_1018643 [Neoantrodia serialis]